MKKAKCYQCKGRGWVREPIDWLPAVLSFGFTALLQMSFSYECPACDGLGYIEDEKM